MLLVITGFTAGAQNFIREYPIWNSGDGSQFVYSNTDGYTTVGIKSVVGLNSIELIRTDLTGDTLFTKTLVDSISIAKLKRFGPDSEGCHFLTFNKNNLTCVGRFTPDWDLQWIQKFDFNSHSISLTTTRDNNVLLSGSSASRLYLYSLTYSGNILWQKSMITENSERPITIFELENGDISIPVEMYHWYEMIYYNLNIFYFSPSGDSLSYKSVPLVDPWPKVIQIIKSNDTLAIIYLKTHSPGNQYNLMYIKTDGTFISEREITLFDSVYAIKNTLLTSAHELVVAGIKEGPVPDFSSVFIHAMTLDGDSLWSVYYGDNYGTNVSDIQSCPDGGYIVSGNFGSTSERTIFLLKTDSLGNLGNLGTEKHPLSAMVSVYPNPATEAVVFETVNRSTGLISITDIYGRHVAEVMVTGEKTVWNTKGFQAGVYLYKMNAAKQVASGKIILSNH
jgi:hypothetical protein